MTMRSVLIGTAGAGVIIASMGLALGTAKVSASQTSSAPASQPATSQPAKSKYLQVLPGGTTVEAERLLGKPEKLAQRESQGKKIVFLAWGDEAFLKSAKARSELKGTGVVISATDGKINNTTAMVDGQLYADGKPDKQVLDN